MRTRLKIVRTTAEPIQVKEAAFVELPRDAATMWSFMWDPASSVELDNTIEMGVTLPGTGSQSLGEIQVFIKRTVDGRREGGLHEVVELQPGRRATTRHLAAAYPAFGTLTIEPLGPLRAGSRRSIEPSFPPAFPLFWCGSAGTGCYTNCGR